MYWTHDIMLQASSASYLSEDQLVAVSKRITCPSLLLTGDNGWPLEDTKVQTLMTAFPAGTLTR